MALSQQQTISVTNSLSPVRMGTYLTASGFSGSASALDIYVWNAVVSSAFFSTLHICEVVLRNAVAHALELKYGANWPWDAGFERSLPNWLKMQLQTSRKGISVGSSGKVIAELKFAFWSHMFKSNQDQHLWNAHLHTVFPNMPKPLTVATGRAMLYDDMEALRVFRNRIAHHEPIFAYPLKEQQARIERLIRLRCEDTGDWLLQWETVTAALAARP